VKKYNEHILSLCWTEAGKKQVNIAQMREIMGIVAHMVATQPEFLAELLRVGIKKAKRIDETTDS